MDFKIRDFLYPFQIVSLKRDLNKLEKLPYEDLIEYQNKKLRELINYAYDFVPYYKELFDKHKIKPDKIRTIKDLSIVPVLTKKIVRERFDSLTCDRKFFKKYRSKIYCTSGSTGTPLRFYHDRYTNISKFAFLWRMWEWAGYKIGKRWAVTSNSFINNFIDNNNVFIYKRSANALYISNYKINEENSLKILDELIRFKCEILRGYPSTMYNFLNYIENNQKIEMLSLKSVISTAENLFDFQREKIESILKVKVFNSYSQWEWVCLAMECENGNMHHQMENGILEILDNNNNVLEDGKSGEITATGFYNKTMPLIRYKTGDLAVKRRSNCNCKRAHDIIDRIDGRIEDVIITPDNRFISGIYNAFKYNTGFDFAQIIQNSKDSIDVKIVRNTKFSEKEQEILNKNLRLRLGDEIRINFLFVPKIEPSKNGKIRFVINNLIKKK